MADEGLDGMVSRVRRWLDAEDSESTVDASAAEDRAVDLPDVAAEKTLSPADFLMETGMSREAYVLQVIRHHGGVVRQRTLTERLDWSASAVSRLLSRMEDAGTVDRCFVDGEKIVTLPDEGDG